MKIKLLFLLPLVLYSCGVNHESSKVFKVQTYSVGVDASAKSLSFPGRVKASEEVNVSFKVAGVINAIKVKEGDRIRKGQLLASIDPKDYKIEFTATEAQYKQILAEAQRVMRLFKDSVVSENDYDKARYGLEQIKAKLDFSKNQIEDCNIYAPFNGYVHQVYYESSSIIAHGVPVMTILSDAAPEVEIDIPASVYSKRNEIKNCYADFSYAELGNNVKLSVVSISPKANANQLYTMRLAIASSLSKMPNPGMISMVSIEFKNSSKIEYSTLPVNSVFEYGGNDNIWIIDADSTVRMKQVKISKVNSDGTVSIEGNLPVGTNVVSAGVHKLIEGQRVEIMQKSTETNVGGIL